MLLELGFLAVHRASRAALRAAGAAERRVAACGCCCGMSLRRLAWLAYATGAFACPFLPALCAVSTGHYRVAHGMFALLFFFSGTVNVLLCARFANARPALAAPPEAAARDGFWRAWKAACAGVPIVATPIVMVLGAALPEEYFIGYVLGTYEVLILFVFFCNSLSWPFCAAIDTLELEPLPEAACVVTAPPAEPTGTAV